MEEIYSEKNEELRVNILIHQIIKNCNHTKKIVVIINEKYDCSKDDIKLKTKNKVFTSMFISEEDVLNNDVDGDVYILMNTQIYDNLEKILEKVSSKKVIRISRDQDTPNNQPYSMDQLKFIYSKKWRNKTFLYNTEIIEWIQDTIEVAEDRIYLECPWFNDKAFNKTFEELIEDAVKRGVDVRIKYGINLGEDSRSGKTKRLIGSLKRLEKYKNFHLIEANSHAKVVYIDNQYLSGSLNFGSNDLNDKNVPEEKANITVYNSANHLYEIEKSFSIDDKPKE